MKKIWNRLIRGITQLLAVIMFCPILILLFTLSFFIHPVYWVLTGGNAIEDGMHLFGKILDKINFVKEL